MLKFIALVLNRYLICKYVLESLFHEGSLGDTLRTNLSDVLFDPEIKGPIYRISIITILCNSNLMG